MKSTPPPQPPNDLPRARTNERSIDSLIDPRHDTYAQPVYSTYFFYRSILDRRKRALDFSAQPPTPASERRRPAFPSPFFYHLPPSRKAGRPQTQKCSENETAPERARGHPTILIEGRSRDGKTRKGMGKVFYFGRLHVGREEGNESGGKGRKELAAAFLCLYHFFFTKTDLPP